MKVGFIGLGIMGRPMAEHMVKAGLDVMVSDLNEKIVAELVAEGATAGSNKELAEQCDVVEMILPNASIVKNVIFGEGGLMDYMKAGQIVVDHSSVTANDSRECYEKLQEKGIGFLDAPVSGGESGAKAGTLAIMVGGDEADFRDAEPIFRAMGTNIRYMGGAGCGQHTKMANQIAIAGAVSGVCEALSYAEHMGLDTRKMLDSISQGAAGSWQMSNVCPKMMAEDYAPGFFLKHFIKDMTIAASQGAGELPVLRQVLSEYQELEAAGEGDLGTQALIRWYRKA